MKEKSTNKKYKESGKQKNGRSGAKGNNRKKNSNNLLVAAAALILCVALVVTIAENREKDADTSGSSGTSSGYGAGTDTSGSGTSGNNTGSNAGSSNDVQVIGEGESLIIQISDISSTASFYPVEVDGTQMEVIAVADSDGNIRTAFNTCQICYSSGKGYYVQSGNKLVCQNCGNRFTVDDIEVESGGCNPWPIFSENKTVTEETIEISYEYLSEAKSIFAKWKTN